MSSLTRSTLIALLLSCYGAHALPSQQPSSLKVRALEGETVPNSWIIRYKGDIEDSAIKASQAKTASLLKKRDPRNQIRSDWAEPRHFNLSGFLGTHVHGDEAAIHELAADPAIDYISPDGKLETQPINFCREGRYEANSVQHRSRAACGQGDAEERAARTPSGVACQAPLLAPLPVRL